MRRYVGLSAVLVLASCGGGVAGGAATRSSTQTGVAASCAGLSPAQQFAAARRVFVGVMLPGPSTRRDGRRVLGSPARMRVARYLKGHGPATVLVDTAVTIESDATGIAEDGIEPQAGERWEIYTSSRRQPFATSICAGSRRVPSRLRGAAGALALWRAFPVHAAPRPIVALGEGVVLDPPGGFQTAAQKEAYLEGRFVLRAAVPGPGALRFGRYHVAAAAIAYERLRAHAHGRPTSVTPLIVTAVKPGTAVFVTDRGHVRLPTWRFFFEGVSQPAAVLALASPELFTPPPLHRFGPPGPGSSLEDTAKAAAPGNRIEISFAGALPGTGPCEANYRAGAVSSDRAVAFTIATTAAPVPPGQACPAIAVTRTVTLHLGRPLGARVLISAIDGGAVPVAVWRTRP